MICAREEGAAQRQRPLAIKVNYGWSRPDLAAIVLEALAGAGVAQLLCNRVMFENERRQMATQTPPQANRHVTETELFLVLGDRATDAAKKLGTTPPLSEVYAGECPRANAKANEETTLMIYNAPKR